MKTARRFLVAGSVCVLAAACARLSEDRTGEAAAGLSFASGNNDGYCASNPSPECGEGTPLSDKTLVFTFDDGPGTQTAAFADWLNSQGIRATFFVNGMHFGSNPGALLAQELSDGHLVGNHTQDHLDLTTLSNSQIISEVTETDDIIAPYVDHGHFVFRAPYGSWDANDYSVLHATAMDKYAGPVKWDIGGQMTDQYAADWDCWQNTSGYGVMTTKQCGDRYLQEIHDVGRGIVIMHDQDYGDVNNHNLTSGEGNTIDMVKYILPILQQEGYSFIRLDEVPAIAANFSSTGGGGTDSGGSGSCAFDPTWQQTAYANDWWVEYQISGDITAANLEVVGKGTVDLSMSFGKWVGGPSFEIPSGTNVIVHATNGSAQTAQTETFPYLVTTDPTTACGAGGGGTDSGTTKDAGIAKDAGTTKDAGKTDAGGGGTDAGTCNPALEPTWSQGSGANNWWVEYAINAGSDTIASAYLEVVGGETVTLSYQSGKWVGPASARIATGQSVIVHANDSGGNKVETNAFGYLSVTKPTTAACAK